MNHLPKLLPLALPVLLPACSSYPRPGRARTAPASAGLVQSLSQPENPATPTRQTQHTIHTRTCLLPSAPPPRQSKIEIPPESKIPFDFAVARLDERTTIRYCRRCHETLADRSDRAVPSDGGGQTRIDVTVTSIAKLRHITPHNAT